MKLRVPEYFKDFHCIANKCKDSCCKNWEIDIDEKTLDFYQNYKGDFKINPKKNIDKTRTPHFILNSNNSCPFLNNQNLCDIFINLGEEYLCKICSEHPRFYEWFNDYKEGGIGICCEEACRIVLSYKKPFRIIELDTLDEISENDFYDTNTFDYLYISRNKIIKYLENSTIALGERIKNILWYSFNIQRNIDIQNFEQIEISDFKYKFPNSSTNIDTILNLYTNLDYIDETFKKQISSIKNFSKKFSFEEFEKNNKEKIPYLQNLLIYFIWRYFLKSVFDEDVMSKVIFASISILIISLLFSEKNYNFTECIEISKNYSKEFEYCENNLEKIQNSFFIENIINLF